jgi:hypothetical protein
MTTMTDLKRKATFREELEALINQHCVENVSDTPDYILASFLTACLSAFDGATVERDRWHGWRDGQPGQGGPLKKWQAGFLGPKLGRHEVRIAGLDTETTDPTADAGSGDFS